MSTTGWLACTACSTCLFLGKAIGGADDRVAYFQDGYVPNSEQRDRTRALWKFLADHATHPLLVLLPGVPGYNHLDDLTEIGGDRVGDIPFDDYLSGWPG